MLLSRTATQEATINSHYNDNTKHLLGIVVKIPIEVYRLAKVLQPVLCLRVVLGAFLDRALPDAAAGLHVEVAVVGAGLNHNKADRWCDVCVA